MSRVLEMKKKMHFDSIWWLMQQQRRRRWQQQQPWRRWYSMSNMDWKKMRPMILKRIQDRAKDYPIEGMIPVATDVLKIRAFLTAGVSNLLRVFPLHSCKFCPEVFIGEMGHQIRTCHGFRHIAKNRLHHWMVGHLKDILIPVEAFRLDNMFQDIIKHDERFDYDRIPAVVELCHQAGADISAETLQSYEQKAYTSYCDADICSPDVLRAIAQRTLDDWESFRSGVQRLLLVYPAKVCKHCSEVHIGPSGHRARLCGVFKFEKWNSYHFWKKAVVDDLVPPKIVWHARRQDPPVLVDSGRGFYGHAPAVVDLCAQAGAVIPTKYFSMMKVDGWAPTSKPHQFALQR